MKIALQALGYAAIIISVAFGVALFVPIGIRIQVDWWTWVLGDLL